MTTWKRSWGGGSDPSCCRLNHFWSHVLKQLVRLVVEQSGHSLPRACFLMLQRSVVCRLRQFFVLAAAYFSVIRQYVVGTDLPEQRLLGLMDILGLDPAQRAKLRLGLDAWIKVAVENKSSWKQLVKPVLTHIGSPALGPPEMVQCPDCHKSFLVKGLGAHRARVHNVFRVARTVVDRSGICRGKV